MALADEQGAGLISIKPLSWGTWPRTSTSSMPDDMEMLLKS